MVEAFPRLNTETDGHQSVQTSRVESVSSPLVPLSVTHIALKNHKVAIVVMVPEMIVDVNTVAEYLAQNAAMPQVGKGHTTIVLVGSAILPTMRAVFDYLSDIGDSSNISLLLGGGIGHSTHLLRAAIIAAFPIISAETIMDLPEARIFEKAMREQWPKLSAKVDSGEVRLLVEDRSTNCGANATMAVSTMQADGLWPDKLVVVQDPTMMRRTMASFNHVYDSLQRQSGVLRSKIPVLDPWSTFTPYLTINDGSQAAQWDISDYYGRNIAPSELWTMTRFLELIVGEVDRLFDNADGYGPKGKGYIGHVDVPECVLKSWERLKEFGGGREACRP